MAKPKMKPPEKVKPKRITTENEPGGSQTPGAKKKRRDRAIKRSENRSGRLSD